MPRRPPSRPSSKAFLPTTREEMEARRMRQADVVFVTGDAYVDHPSFAMAILGRVLESHGFSVAILSQPDWKSVESFRSLGRPRLFFAVSAGNMDSMINHYTANRRLRSDDAYSPGGKAGRRPDRAASVYAQRCREAFPGVPVIAGGVEASLRRLTHYDYWSDTVRPSVLVSSKADAVVFGMGESLIVEIARRLDEGEGVQGLRDLRGVTYMLGAKEELPPFPAMMRANGTPEDADRELPSFEAMKESKEEFARGTWWIHHESNPHNARRLLQRHGNRLVVQNPPCLPLTTREMDAIYDLPYQRCAHPRYAEPVPAEQMMRTSVTIMRGCFGGCTFCSITAHQGRIIQSRSRQSILAEVEKIGADRAAKGQVSDLGGPTANMYRLRCSRPEVEAKCRRLSCVFPTVCRLLGTDHGPLVRLMKESRETEGIKKVNIASGVRMDLARRSREYLDELVRHHVGGHLKVAPEHVSDRVLEKMKKPPQADFEEFASEFHAASQRAGKEQYLVPYFIASHPGSDLEDMIDLALYLKKNGYKPRQVQDFIPSPLDLASAMYHTGLDPQSLRPIPVARNLKDRRAQRALMQFFEPANWFEVERALKAAGRADLIGDGPDCLIPAQPPKAARDARRRKMDEDFGKYVHEKGRRPEDWDAFTGYRDGEKKAGADGEDAEGGGKGPERREPSRGRQPARPKQDRRSVGYRPHRGGGPGKKTSDRNRRRR